MTELQLIRCELFARGTSGWMRKCSWRNCGRIATKMELRSYMDKHGRKRQRAYSYCIEHADRREREIEKMDANERLTKRLLLLEGHVRKLRKACELALFGVTKDADVNDGQVDRDGIRETMEIVLEETK